MRPVCPTCGGPLFKQKCLGVCAARPEKGVRRPAVSRFVSADDDAPIRRDYSLVWKPTYQTPKGLPLNVARWDPYAVTPAGDINVWHRLLERVA